jgi:hypothetical protein
VVWLVCWVCHGATHVMVMQGKDACTGGPRSVACDIGVCLLS